MVSMRDPAPFGFHGVDEMLRAVAEKHGTCVAFHEKKQGFYQHISYGRFLEECEALCLMLARLLPPTLRVLLVGKNGYHWALSFLALLGGAGLPVLADSDTPAKEIDALAVRCEVSAVLCDTAVKARIKAPQGVAVIGFDELEGLIAKGKAAIGAGELLTQKGASAPEAPAAIFCVAKGVGECELVTLTRKGVLATLHALGEAKTVSEQDIFLSVLSPSSLYECILGLLYPLSRGASIAFGEGVGSIMQNMREIHPTAMVCVPYLAERIFDKFWELVGEREAQVRRAIAISDPVRPLFARQALKERLLAAARAPFGGALRHLLVVGEPLPQALSKGLRQIGIFAVQCYGAAVGGGLVAMTTPTAYRDGTVGMPLPHVTLEIDQKQEDGSGEVVICGDALMLDGEKNGTQAATALCEGRYFTGDMGRIDSDGFLHIIGKKQNCIICADGTRISPEEIEQMLMQSPLVREAVVVGIESDGGEGLVPAAMILPDAAYAKELGLENGAGEALECAVYEWICEINKALFPAAEILFFALSEAAFPRDNAGRVMRASVADMLKAAKDGAVTLNEEEYGI